jgi:hypothetical protein
MLADESNRTKAVDAGNGIPLDDAARQSPANMGVGRRAITTDKRHNVVVCNTTLRTMAARSHVLIAIFVLVCATLAFPSASAWSNGGYSADPNNPDYGTHDWIADNALTIQTRDISFLRVTYHSLFLLGTEAPDNPDYIGDTAKHHVYYTAGHELEDDASAARASQIYDLAKGFLDAKDYQSAAYDIGVLAHYVSDPGVFGHTMGADTDWGTEVHHSDYETYVNSMISSLSLPAGTALGDADAYSATLGLAEDITFGYGAIRSNIWMDANYNWADNAFISSASASLYGSTAAVAAVINHIMIATSSPPPQVPQAPTSLVASIESSNVVLTWAAPLDDGGADITGYKIYRGEEPSEQVYVASVPADVHRWTDESVESGKTYYYWVVADNSVGSSDMSQVAHATAEKGHNYLLVPIVVSAISLALASGGVIVWRIRRRSA